MQLGEIMLSRGGTVDPTKFPDEKFELYSIPAHDKGVPEKARGSQIGSSKKVVQPGDVLLSRIVPHIRRVQIVPESNGSRQIASSEWIIFRSRDVDSNYLQHFLRSDRFHAQFMNTVAGVGGSLLRARPDYVKSISIPAPPVLEQQRLARILDHADALRGKILQNIDLYAKLAQAIFQEMFGENRHGYTELGSISEVSSGITKGRRTTKPTVETPYLAVANVQSGYLALEDVKTIGATEAEIARYTLECGDIVLTEGGDPDKLGRGTVWRNELPICIHQNHIFRVRTGKEILPDYLSAYLASHTARSYFLRSAKQTTGIASINITQLRATPILVAPISEQQRFVSRIRQIDISEAAVKKQLQAAEELFASLQSRAFRGEL